MLEQALRNDDTLLIPDLYKKQITLSDISEDLFCSVKENVIQTKDYHYSLSLKRIDFETEKEFDSFIKNSERLVRVSNEYRLWINYLRESLNYKFCQITEESLDDVSVEVHHHPFSLFLLSKYLISEKMSLNEEFSTFDIASEIMFLHFNMKVGFILLVKTLHEKFHNGSLDLPMELIKGDYTYLLDRFLKYASDSELNMINKYLSVNFNNCNWELKWPKIKTGS